MASASQTSEFPIPLTTPFSPPASCLQHLTLSISVSSDNTWQSLEPAFRGRTECFPDHFESMYIGSEEYYSPGVCPISYYSACIPDLPASVNGWSEGEGGCQCCPSGYECLTYEWCVSSITGTVTVTVVPDGVVVTETKIATLPNPDGDYSLEGEWQSDAYASAIQIRFSGTPTGLTTAPASTQGSSAGNGNPRLNGGAIAGIVIGGFFFVLLLVVLAVVILYPRARRAASTIVMRRYLDEMDQEKRDREQTGENREQNGEEITDNRGQSGGDATDNREQNGEDATDNHKQNGEEITESRESE